MPDSVAMVRYSPVYIAVSALMGLMAIAFMLFVWRATEAPPISYALLVFAALGVGVVCLLAGTGAMPLVSATPHSVTYKVWWKKYQQHTDLYPGDALVVTDEQLLIWRAGGWYEQVEVPMSWGNRKDWERFRVWADQIWPQPPDCEHQQAIVER